MVFVFVVFILFDHPWIAERSTQRPALRGQEIAEEVFFIHCTSKFLDSSKMDRPKKDFTLSCGISDPAVMVGLFL